MQRGRGRRERRGARRKDGREGRHSPSRALAGGRGARGGQPGGRVPRRSSPPTRRDQRSGPRELSAEAPREPPRAPRTPRPRPSALRRRSGSARAPRAAAGGAEHRPPPVSTAHRPERRPPPVTTAHRPERRPPPVSTAHRPEHRPPPMTAAHATRRERRGARLPRGGTRPGLRAPGESGRGDTLSGLPLPRAGVERSSRSAAPPRPCSPVDLTWGVPPSAVGCLRAFPALGGSQGSCLPGSPRHVELVLDPGDCPEEERTPLAPARPTRAPGWRLGGARVLAADPGTPRGAGLGAPPGSGAAAGRRVPCSLRTVSGCVDSSHPRSGVNESLA